MTNTATPVPTRSLNGIGYAPTNKSAICENCGENIFYTIGRPGGWIHEATYKAHCQKADK